MKTFNLKTVVILAIVFTLNRGLAQALSPQGLTLQGTILTPAGLPEEAGSVSFTVQIKSPGVENCLLYQESQTLNMNNSGGAFSLIVGTGTRPGGGFQATSTLAQVFNNASGAITSLTCASGTSYTPASADSRKVTITFDDGSGPQTLTQTLSVQAVPYALYADTLQGKTPTDLLQVNTGTAAVSQTNVESVFSSASAVTDLLAIINGTSTKYMTSSASGGARLPTYTTGSPPSSPAAGDIWYNNTTNSVQYYNGSSTQAIGNGTITGVTAGTGLSGGGTTGGVTLNLANTAVTAGSYGSATQVPTISVDAQGRVTAASNTTISGIAPSGAASGDLSGSYPGPAVAKIQGTSVSATAPTTGQFMKYGGASWAGSNINLSDLKSSVVGNLFSSPNCSSTQTLTWSVITDQFTCQTITFSSAGANSQVQFNSSGSLGADSNFVWDNTNKRVGIGTAAPAESLEVVGAVKVGTTANACTTTNKGSIRYNNTSSVLEFCNGTSWNLVQAAACTSATPGVFSFTDEANATTSTLYTSNVVQITGINCTVPVTISGPGSPQYQICADAACGTVVQGWTSSPSSITNNQYIQTRQTTDTVGGSTFKATVIVGSGATVWNVTTTGSCAGGSPAIGTVCADGTVYAGLSPDTGTAMYAQRCDLGQTWNGVSCTGSRSSLNWNNGTGNWTMTGFSGSITGKSNSAGIAALSDAGSPHEAAKNCENLSENGYTDWYLPALAELNVLYSNKGVIKNFDLTGNWYWSSTENGSPYAWRERFSDGSQYNPAKNVIHFVRCVRR